MRIAALTIVLPILAAGCATTGAVPRPFPGAPVAAASAPTDGTALVRTALELRGVPYRDGGTDPTGFDCSGFVRYVFAQHGRPLPRDVRDQFSGGRRVSVDDARPGDLVFFSTVARGASHVGLVVSRGEFVHAPSSRGRVRVERLDSAYWSDRLVGVRRVL